MYYVFHGEDEFSRSEALISLKSRMGDPDMASLNTTRLDGQRVTLDELKHHCDAVPFLTERRLVIVDGLLGRLAGGRGKRGKGQPAASDKEYLQKLLDYLPRLPETTRLVFVEHTSLKPSHPVLKLALANGERGFVREFRPPEKGALERWIRERVGKKGGETEPAAGRELATFVGNDLRLLDQEIEKLVTYTAGRRPITVDDVHTLVPYTQEASVFDMVDAVGRRDGRTALTLLHRMLDDGQEPLYILAMIVRQFRIMVQVKDLEERGGAPGAMAKRLGLHPFVAKKGLAQAHNFTMAQLEAIYDKLLETDLAIKTGRMEDVLALDMLVAGLSRSRA